MEGKFLGELGDNPLQKIDSRIVFNSKNKEDIYFNSTKDDKIDLLIYTTLIFNCNVVGKIIIDVKTLLHILKLKPRSGNGNINSKIRDSINRLNDNGFIKIKFDKEINSYHVKVNFINSNEGFEIYYKDINKILGLDCSFNHKCNILYLYFYSKAKNENLGDLLEISNYCDINYETLLNLIQELKSINLLTDDYFINKYYVYIHINKLNDEVLYVGKGTKDRYNNLDERNDFYLSYISELGKENIECKIVKTFKNEEESFIFEEDLTNVFKMIGQAKYCIKIGK